MDKSEKQTAFLCSIVYFSQGALGIAGITLPLFLRSLNWSISEITVASSIVATPWVIKIFYGLLSDTLPLFGYRRKSYLILCSTLAATGWLMLVVLPPEKMWILFSLIVANIGFAATDVITDGVVVEHSTAETSPFFQGIAWGSRSIGAIVSGFAGGWLAAHWIPYQVFVLTMTLPIIVMITSIFLTDVKTVRLPFHNAAEPVKKCLKIISTPNIKWFICLLIVVSMSSSFGVPFFFHLKETLKFHETFLGLLSSLGWAGALVGSIIYVRFFSALSPKVILTWAILIGSVNIFSTLFIYNQATALTLIVMGGILSYFALLPIMASAAVLTHGSGVEGTLFAILMGIYNLGQVVFGFLGGKLYPYIGLQAMILITGILVLFGLFFVAKLDFKSKPHPPGKSAA